MKEHSKNERLIRTKVQLLRNLSQSILQSVLRFNMPSM